MSALFLDLSQNQALRAFSKLVQCLRGNWLNVWTELAPEIHLQLLVWLYLMPTLHFPDMQILLQLQSSAIVS